jgi:hypothetical protein
MIDKLIEITVYILLRLAMWIDMDGMGDRP